MICMMPPGKCIDSLESPGNESAHVQAEYRKNRNADAMQQQGQMDTESVRLYSMLLLYPPPILYAVVI